MRREVIDAFLGREDVFVLNGHDIVKSSIWSIRFCRGGDLFTVCIDGGKCVNEKMIHLTERDALLAIMKKARARIDALDAQNSQG